MMVGKREAQRMPGTMQVPRASASVPVGAEWMGLVSPVSNANSRTCAYEKRASLSCTSPTATLGFAGALPRVSEEARRLGFAAPSWPPNALLPRPMASKQPQAPTRVSGASSAAQHPISKERRASIVASAPVPLRRPLVRSVHARSRPSPSLSLSQLMAIGRPARPRSLCLFPVLKLKLGARKKEGGGRRNEETSLVSLVRGEGRDQQGSK
mmetsp:Transcript_2595/g.6204  ORF Transcript_2595/g.6204 Transcript_2595/m.6204 type:complete len:211 (-) Transcript_2595:584-1216(-)